MPRPQHHGRPGTRIIPKRWEAEHAVVVGKTLTASIVIRASSEGAGSGSLNEDLTRTPGTPPAVLYTGPARIQVQNGQQKRSEVADQSQVTLDYLVVLDRNVAGADEVAVRAVVEITDSSDPSLGGTRRLYVAKVERGSLRWERDLFCVDDITRLS